MIKQINLLAVDQRQKIPVQIALRARRRLVLNPTLAERLTRPFATVAIADDGADAVALEQISQLDDNTLRTERRSTARTDGSARNSRTASMMVVVSCRWPIARVKLSAEPPEGSTNAA